MIIFLQQHVSVWFISLLALQFTNYSNIIKEKPLTGSSASVTFHVEQVNPQLLTNHSPELRHLLHRSYIPVSTARACVQESRRRDDVTGSPESKVESVRGAE